MYKQAKFITGVAVTVTLSSLAVGTAIAQTQLTNQSKIFINGVGPVRVGMTVVQAEQAAGKRLVSVSGVPIDKQAGCFYVKPQRGPNGVELMLASGRIARVDIVSNSPVTTLSGARIGDTEARIKSLYPGKIKVEPHKYVPDGHYLTFVPKDAADRNYRLIFETDGKRVTYMRAGKLPEVAYVERCG